MRRFVSSLTGPLPLRTLETVATDTFASRATSLIVTMLLTGGRANAEALPDQRQALTGTRSLPARPPNGKYVIVYIEGASATLRKSSGMGQLPRILPAASHLPPSPTPANRRTFAGDHPKFCSIADTFRRSGDDGVPRVGGSVRSQPSARATERGRILLLGRLALHQHPATATHSARASAVRTLRSYALGRIQRHHHLAVHRAR